MPKQFGAVNHPMGAVAAQPSLGLLKASRHGRMHKGLGCCMHQCCAGLRVAEMVVTAHGVHLAFLHTPKQYGTGEQAMGRMVASATLGLKPARAIGRRHDGLRGCRLQPSGGGGGSVETAPGLR
jgi:hypothetical protein